MRGDGVYGASSMKISEWLNGKFGGEWVYDGNAQWRDTLDSTRQAQMIGDVLRVWRFVEMGPV